METIISPSINNKIDSKGSIPHLVVLPCHGIWTPTGWEGIYPGEGKLLEQHAIQALEFAYNLSIAKETNLIFVISGGMTCKNKNLSEARSLYNFLQSSPTTAKKLAQISVLLEEYARDSLENVLFSVLLFSQHVSKLFPNLKSLLNTPMKTALRFSNSIHKTKTFSKFQSPGNFVAPKSINIFGWSFKKSRFELHLASLLLDGTYHGVNNPVDDDFEKNEANLYSLYLTDLLGETFIEKRKLRDPYLRGTQFKL